MYIYIYIYRYIQTVTSLPDRQCPEQGRCFFVVQDFVLGVIYIYIYIPGLCNRNRAQTYPQKLPNAPSEFLQLLFGGSKLQASGLQKGPLATAKQHLIACRNRARTYPHKLPNAPSEFLEKISLFFCLLQLLFGVPSCKHQACRSDPSPQQNST